MPGSQVERNVAALWHASHMRMTGGVDRIRMYPFNSRCTSSTYLRHVATFPITVIFFCGVKVHICPGAARWKASNRERWRRRGGWKDSREKLKVPQAGSKNPNKFFEYVFLRLNCGTRLVFVSDAFLVCISEGDSSSSTSYYSYSTILRTTCVTAPSCHSKASALGEGEEDSNETSTSSDEWLA